MRQIVWFNASAARLLGLDGHRHRGLIIDRLIRNPQILAWLAQARANDPLIDVPSPATPEIRMSMRLIPYAQGQWLLVPLWHVFGSEELSRLAAGVASLSPAPYVAVNPAEERNRVFVEGQMACVAAQGRTYRLPVRIDRSLPAGTAGIPAGLVPGVSLPAWGVLEPRTAKET